MRNPAITPWGIPLICRVVTPGVFCVNTPTQTGIMVRDDLVSTTCSDEALKYGFQSEEYYCFEGYNNSYMAPLLGLHEDTVFRLMQIAANESEEAQDALDDVIYAVTDGFCPGKGMGKHDG